MEISELFITDTFYSWELMQFKCGYDGDKIIRIIQQDFEEEMSDRDGKLSVIKGLL